MRFFIALEIPYENLLQFQAIQAKLSKLIPHARMTDLDKIFASLPQNGLHKHNTLAEIRLTP